MRFWQWLVALPGVLAQTQTGEVQFLPRQVDAVESRDFVYLGQYANYDYIGLVRVNGTNGTLTATLTQLPGTTAIEGVDFDFYQNSVTWQDGDWEPKAILFIVYDNQIAGPVKVVNIGIDTVPINATSGDATFQAIIRDNNDGGTISITPLVVPLDEKFGHDECIMWAERQGHAFSGRTELFVETVTCDAIQPRYRAETGRDFWALPQAPEQGIVWEDGESDRKCVVRNLAFQTAVDLNGRSRSPENVSLFVLLNPDAEPEAEERICINATLSANSTAILQPTSQQTSIAIVDVDLSAELKLNCTRGLACVLDVSALPFVGNDSGFVQDAGDSPEQDQQCLSTCDPNNSSGVVFFRTDGDAKTTSIDVGYALRDWKPGEKLICKCNSLQSRVSEGATSLLAKMQLHGPYLSNTAACAQSWPTCNVADLLGLGFKVGTDHLRVMKSCSNAASTPHELAVGSHAIYGSDGQYRMESFELMRPTRVGFYNMCWCRETAERNCSEHGDFSVSAGTFVYVGPNARSWMDPYELGSWNSFQVPEVYGTGLRLGDRAMLLLKCGEEGSADVNVSADYNEALHVFDFGVLSASDGLLATVYAVCWCQTDHEMGFHCDSAAEFRAEMGKVAFLCPRREVDRDRDGVCDLCPLMFQTAGGWDSMECVIDGNLFLLTCLLFIVSTLLFLSCTTSLRFSGSRRFGFVQGVPRLIEDISQESGSVLVTVVGYHNLTVFTKTQSIPVKLTGTGHFLLDTQYSKSIALRARPIGSNTLELLDADGNTLKIRADSSMGLLRLSMFRALLHSTILGVKFPLFAQIIVLLSAYGVICGFLNPVPGEVGAFLLLPLIFALGITVIWRFVLRTSSSLTRRLERFSQELKKRNPHPRACKKGPDRAIAVRDVVELYDKFGAFIKDRNMYYIDPNILRRLTKNHKLSYAELVGPQKVQWFVSHWWGTPYYVYCRALQRHAKAVCDTADDVTWGATSYWICTFSNNQYQIKEELGSSHRESSFYLALHSGICRGTCMILDEMAMPLKRSWCLFELLQTISLEATQVGFKGLLFCTENGVLNFGASTVEMSMQIGERLSTLSLEDAEATTEQDKNMITGLVLREMDSFEKIDKVLREHIGDALGICRDRVDGDFTSLFKKLGTWDYEVSGRRALGSVKQTKEAPDHTSI